MKHSMHTPPGQGDMRNVIIAAVLCTGLLFLWQVFYANPMEAARRALVSEQAQLQQQTIVADDGDVVLPQNMNVSGAGAIHADGAVEVSGDIGGLTRDAAIASAPRLRIESPAVHGSINLQGLRFDDLTLRRHRVSVDKNSPEVVLLTPAQSSNRHFLQVGWLPATQGSGIQLPDGNTLWAADSERLTPNQPVTLSWTNPQGIEFRAHIALDDDYLFTVRQEVVNHSNSNVVVMPYGLINRTEAKSDRFDTILHLGPIGVFDDTLVEVSYSDLHDDKGKHRYNDTRGWLGIADKYWLTALVPQRDQSFSATFQHVSPRGHDRTQVDYLGHAQHVAPGAKSNYTVHLFAGAKELNVLEKYRQQLDLPLFDRALDFGVLYFLTKPIFITLNYFYGLLGNFGLAILLFVVMLKLVLYPLSNKSYRAMAQMRNLQPQIEQVRKQYEHDRVRMQQEVMAIWQRERVNPVSGCLPILLQLPIFFALYKVLLVTIEMRHAPFYGWIHDLSAPDPTNIFTLFGLLQWNPPGFMHIGLWPIIMCATMVLQQKFNPKPTDPIQAKVIGWLPYIFLVLFASFPAGLLIYWAWNNVLSIVQQAYITHSYEKDKKRKERKRELAELQEQQAAATKAASKKSASKKAASDTSADEKPVEVKSPDGKSADKPVGDAPASKKPASKKPADKTSADKKPAGKKTTGRKLTGAESTGSTSAGGKGGKGGKKGK